MQVWNVLHAAHCKYRMQKSPSGHHRTTLSGFIFATKAHIDNRKKVIKQQYLLHMSPQYSELPPISGWDRIVSLGHPCKFQRVSRLGSVTARHSSIGRQPNFAALNRGRHLYSAGRPSRWALAHIYSLKLMTTVWEDNDSKLFKIRFRVDVRKFVFSNRVVNNRNSLPAHCVNCNSINTFKTHRLATLQQR